MTAERNGAESTPEGDDPFAHLYRQEGGDGSAPPASQPGVPRRSYNQVRNVGERQYGQGQGGYGQQPSAHYAAPETVPGGRAAARQGPPGDGGRRRSRNGLLAGALAVVAAVVIGIGAAVFFNTDDSQAAGPDEAGSSETSASGGDEAGKDSASAEPKQKLDLPKEDASSLRLDGGTKTDSELDGATAKGGTYVAGMNTGPGAAATWTTNVEKAGTYNLKVRFGVPGKDQHLSLGVNDKPHGTGLNMKNWAGAEEGDWAKGWAETYSTVQLQKGENTMRISCEEGDKCDVNLDRVWLELPKKQ